MIIATAIMGETLQQLPSCVTSAFKITAPIMLRHGNFLMNDLTDLLIRFRRKQKNRTQPFYEYLFGGAAFVLLLLQIQAKGFQYQIGFLLRDECVLLQKRSSMPSNDITEHPGPFILSDVLSLVFT